MALSARQARDAQSTQALAVTEDYQRVRVPIPSGGIRLDKAAVDLELTESPSIINMALLNNELRPDTGYTLFGQTRSGSYYGTVQLTYQVFNPDGTTAELLVTTASVYALNSANNQWELVPFGAYMLNAALINNGDVVATFGATGAVSIGSYLGFPLDDGTQHQATVINKVGLVLTWDNPIPTGRFITGGSNVVIGISLNGTLANQIAAVTFAPKGWVIFSNNVDQLFYYDGAKLVALTGDLPTPTTCRWLIVFHECLFLIATTEIGQQLPQRVRMSDLGDPEAWTPGAGSSIAAIYDLLDTEDFINNASVIGPYLILYRDTTIMRGTYLGLLNNTIFWEYMVYGEGVISVGGVAEIGAEQEFIGNGGVYRYDGGYTLESAGDAIFVGTFSAIGDLNAVQKQTVFAQYVPDYDEFWLFYPSGVATLPDKMLRQSLEKNGWSIRQFANEFVSAQPYLPVASTTWATWAGTWSAQVSQWDSRTFLANVASIVLCAPDTNSVYIYDYRSQTDAGTPIAWSFQTKDISPGDQQFRWDSLRVYAQGSALIEYSTDGGTSFVSLGVLTFGATKMLKTVYFQTVSSYIRFRLSGTDATFIFNWLEAWYLTESEW